MHEDLWDLLVNADEEDGDLNYTHISLYGPRKQWKIPQANYNNFWVQYCDIVSKNPDANLCLAETPKISRITPPRPVLAPPKGSMAEG